MKLNNIIFDLTTEIDQSYNKLIIPYIIFGKIKDGHLLKYISSFVTIETNNLNQKMIHDIEKKINTMKKNKINLSIVIQNKEQYFKVIIMVLKLKKKNYDQKKLNVSINFKNRESSKLLGRFYEQFRLLGSTCINNLKESEIYKSNICLPCFKDLSILINLKTECEANLAFIEGMILTMYKFNKYKNLDDKQANKSYLFNYVSSNKYIESNINKKFNTIKTFFYIKDIINEPSNKISPILFIDTIKEYIKQHNLPLSVIVLDKKKLLKLGMNLIVSVGEGSPKEKQSKLMILVYKPKKKISQKKLKINKKKTIDSSKKKSVKYSKNKIKTLHTILGNNNPDYILVGKGVTFDTGGISLKSSRKMREMKSDKTGAAVVSGFIMNYSANKGSKTIVGFIPLAENSIGSNATVPGDIITAYNNKSVEILNTDAEGRLLMADCLAYSTTHFKKSKLIDISTLTGQQANLSGNQFGNVIGRHYDFCQNIVNSGYLTNEKIVYLPYLSEFEIKMKSKAADYKNINDNSRASIMLSSSFLGLFVSPDQKWVHLDIAGMDWNISADFPYMSGEGSGFGYRMLNNLITI